MAVLALILLSGCVAESLAARQFGELLSRYPSTGRPLRIEEVAPAARVSVPAEARGRTVTIIVHPAYSLFFREEAASRYSDAKYELLKMQLESEERFMQKFAQSGKVMILVLPGNYVEASVAPLSYTAYLNRATEGSRTVYYVYSETANNGALPTETLVKLYSFLQGLETNRVIVGGGYIGRCLQDFYKQMVTYVDNISFYVAPEISSISPDDISDRQSREVLNSIRIGDYAPVTEFIRKRTKGSARTIPLPQF